MDRFDILKRIGRTRWDVLTPLFNSVLRYFIADPTFHKILEKQFEQWNNAEAQLFHLEAPAILELIKEHHLPLVVVDISHTQMGYGRSAVSMTFSVDSTGLLLLGDWYEELVHYSFSATLTLGMHPIRALLENSEHGHGGKTWGYNKCWTISLPVIEKEHTSLTGLNNVIDNLAFTLQKVATAHKQGK